MEYTYLGNTGVQVSRLCFGTMSFGGDADEATSGALFGRCREAGINFFDCADVYSQGKAEEILGRLLQGCRDEIVLTSKVFGAMSDDRNQRGLSRRHITRAVEASLKRLNTDRLDFYFVHQFDANTPMEETLRALDDLVSAGKIVHPAVSNWAAWQIALALGKCELKRWARFACIQPMYSLAKRQAEVEILPLAQSENLGVIPYSPLGGGLLSGKYSKEAGSGRLRDNAMYARRYGDTSYYDLAERFTEYSREHKVHPASLAVAWVMSHPTITAPIIGARNVEQLEPSLQAVDLPMTPQWREEISSLSPTPPPATDRSESQPANK
ncbi:MAG TPA: aldo/keto reductase [Abditibacteriaceae bacterium]|jgi:aryl-alcohol dehydrogenase-like predicted oxidoreductase